jgi:hypothetical protein
LCRYSAARLRAYDELCTAAKEFTSRAEAGLYKSNPVVDPQLETAWFQPSSLSSESPGFKVCFFKCNLDRYPPLDSITIPAAPRLGKTVIEVVGLSKGYDGRGLLMDGRAAHSYFNPLTTRVISTLK